MVNVNEVKLLKRKSTEGFSLLEVMIALTIISIGMLGTAALLAGIIRGNLSSKKVTIATTLAIDRVEYLASLSYSDLPPSGTEDYGSIADYLDFKRVTETSNNVPDTNMTQIKVEVYKKGSAVPVVTYQNIYAR